MFERFTLIAGPCTLEDDGLNLEIGRALATISSDLGLPIIFKASYDKANRTSVSSFRGPGMDPGTAYEIGYMRAKGRPVFAYSNDPASYAGRVPDARPRDGSLVDGAGQSVEDFGLSENLMIACAAMDFSAGVFTPTETPDDPLRDLATFRRVIQALAGRKF